MNLLSLSILAIFIVTCLAEKRHSKNMTIVTDTSLSPETTEEEAPKSPKDETKIQKRENSKEKTKRKSWFSRKKKESCKLQHPTASNVQCSKKAVTLSKMDSYDPLCEEAKQKFKEKYKSSPQIVAVAPGRVNLIGEHTDYQLGYVFPMALNEMKTVVAVSPRTDGQVSVFTTAFNKSVLFATMPDKENNPEKAWYWYILGTIHKYLDVAGIPVNEHVGLDILVHTSVPLGGGLSSSAAVEVATCTAMERLYGKVLTPLEKAEKVCQAAEHEYAGVMCGLMDQAISTMAQKGNAMLFDCKNKVAEHTKLSDAVSFIVIYSGTKHSLVEGEYENRRNACIQAVADISEAKDGVKHLCDCTIEDLKAADSKKPMDPVIKRRAQHVIRENERCLQFRNYLNNEKYEEAGKIMNEGHKSLKEKYDVSTKYIDTLAEIARNTKGVLGARLTGGGFGGSVVVMVKSKNAKEAKDHILKKYLEYYEVEKSKTEASEKAPNFSMAPVAYIVTAGDGPYLYTHKSSDATE